MDPFDSAIRLLGPELRGRCVQLSAEERTRAEEIRLRRGRPPALCIGGKEIPLSAPPVTERDLLQCMELCSGGSAYAVEDELREGFLSAPGGHRLGICGRAVLRGGEVTGFREIASLCLRIARAVPGAADGLIGQMRQGDRVKSTLILSPPGRGKTTLLRDLIRQLSGAGVRIAVADERGEIAGCFRGEAAFPLGPLTDVMTGCPKAEAVWRLLRCMTPRAVALDEITGPADAEAVSQAAFTGVAILATAHAFSPEDVHRRALYRELVVTGVFEQVVFIDEARTPVILPLAEMIS
ncbi:MAG: stage III sporulation protein AB [Clostridia bacterium]|nr:stage III sporulation protein AB [Clostridia bacterium]